MKNVQGRNGGTIKQSEAGDPGNPGAGRPKGSLSASTKFKMFLEGLEEYEVNGQKVKMSREEILMFRLFKIATTGDVTKSGESSGVSIAAIKELHDRAHGKAKEAIDHTSNGETITGGEPLSDEAQQTILKALRPGIITIRMATEPPPQD